MHDIHFFKPALRFGEMALMFFLGEEMEEMGPMLFVWEMALKLFLPFAPVCVAAHFFSATTTGQHQPVRIRKSSSGPNSSNAA